MTPGEWLFLEAGETGDWQSAAIALRTEVEQLQKDKARLVASVEHAWALVPCAVEDPLQDFTVEAKA